MQCTATGVARGLQPRDRIRPMFKALMLDRQNDALIAEIREIAIDDLPAGDVLIDVEYSSLNFKDGLAVTGKGKVIRSGFPFVPGIDLAGTVAASDVADVSRGDRVVVTGWGIGEAHWGGYAQKARVRSAWIIPIPDSLSTHRAMTLGTAGVTAMIALMHLENHGARPGGGEILVTGASGGVGSIAIALLAGRGFQVVASTGSHDADDWLRSLGASEIIDRSLLPQAAAKPLASARWQAAIDTVGGATLAGILPQLQLHGSVAACGNAGGAELQTTVYPFILRGVNLLGVDSNTAPREQRLIAWHRLSADLPEAALERIESEVIALGDLPARCRDISEGRIRGRVVVDLNG